MDAGLLSKPAYDAKPRDLYEKLSPSKSATAGATSRLDRRASLMLTFLLSLGLWAAIWAFVSAVLR